MMKKNWKIKLGLVLVIVSVFLFLFLFSIPFLNFETEFKVKLSTVIFILAEVLFWSGGLLLGKELFTKYKSYLNPKNWLKKKQAENKKS